MLKRKLVPTINEYIIYSESTSDNSIHFLMHGSWILTDYDYLKNLDNKVTIFPKLCSLPINCLNDVVSIVLCGFLI
jgi:hypothetical protein